MYSKTFIEGGGDIDLYKIFTIQNAENSNLSKTGEVASKINRQERIEAKKIRKRATEARSNTYLNMQVAYFVKIRYIDNSTALNMIKRFSEISAEHS
jgi:hypothetical protein